MASEIDIANNVWESLVKICIICQCLYTECFPNNIIVIYYYSHFVLVFYTANEVEVGILATKNPLYVAGLVQVLYR